MSISTARRLINTLIKSNKGQEAIRSFLNQNPNTINQLHENGMTTLNLATYCKHEDLFLCLLKDDRLDLNQQDAKGNTALHYAATHDTSLYTKRLIEKLEREGEDLLLLKNNDGKTAFQVATESGHYDNAHVIASFTYSDDGWSHEEELGGIKHEKPIYFGFNPSRSPLAAATEDADESHKNSASLPNWRPFLK